MQEESCNGFLFPYIAGNRAATIEHLANVLQLADLPSRKSAKRFLCGYALPLELTIVDIEDEAHRQRR